MSMYTMVDMKRDPADVKAEAPCATPCDSSKPFYPYGLQISLSQEELTKLKIDLAACEVGGIMHFHCLARVTAVSAHDYGDGAEARVELQIESMCAESEDAENEEADKEEDNKSSGRRGLAALYGRK